MSDPYFSASKTWAAGASPTDIAIFTAGDRGAKIRKIYVAASQAGGSAGTVRFSLLARSTSDTGGTSADVVSVAKDGVSKASSVLACFTAAPTAGTSAGNYRNAPRDIAATWSAVAEMDFDGKDDENAVNVHAGQKVYLNVGGLPNGATSYITVEWTEAR